MSSKLSSIGDEAVAVCVYFVLIVGMPGQRTKAVDRRMCNDLGPIKLQSAAYSVWLYPYIYTMASIHKYRTHHSHQDPLPHRLRPRRPKSNQRPHIEHKRFVEVGVTTTPTCANTVANAVHIRFNAGPIVGSAQGLNLEFLCDRRSRTCLGQSSDPTWIFAKAGLLSHVAVESTVPLLASTSAHAKMWHGLARQ